MKAVILDEYGNGENLKIKDVPEPEITDDQVLVKIFAASVNHLEIKIASGAMKQFFPIDLPWTPGNDFAGVVEKIGKNVTDFKVGDEVYGDTVKSGAYAEFIAVDATGISFKPASLNFVEAASVPVVAMTAYQGLFLNGRLKAGQTVLIHGGAGAVGAYAVQLAREGGATVIATASAQDADFVRSLGAEKVIDYELERFEESVKDIDLVLDLVGGSTQQRSFAVLKKGGQLVATSQPPSQADAGKYEVKAMMMNMQPGTKDLAEIASLIDSGALKVDVAKIYSLEEAAAAWAALAPNIAKDKETRPAEKIGHGKAVLKIRD